MTKTTCLFFLLTTVAAAQVWVPQGTPVRLQLEQDLRRGVAPSGQTVQLSVVEQVWSRQRVAISVGSPATGLLKITGSQGGVPGTAQLIIDRVRAVDGSWHRLRTTARKEADGAVSAHLPASRPTDSEILYPSGTVFTLYVDQDGGSITPDLVQPGENQRALAYLLGRAFNADSASQPWLSAWLLQGGCLLVLFGMFSRWYQDQTRKAALLARLSSSDSGRAWERQYSQR